MKKEKKEFFDNSHKKIVLDQKDQDKMLKDTHLEKFINVKKVKDDILQVRYYMNNRVEKEFIELSNINISVLSENKSIDSIKSVYNNIEVDKIIFENLIRQASAYLRKEYFSLIEKYSEDNIISEYGFWDKIKSFIHNVFGKKYSKVIKIKNVQQLIGMLTHEKYMIEKNSLCGKANFIICDPYTAIKFKKMYAMCPIPIIQGNNENLYILGTIMGMTIYVDPFMNYKTIFLGVKVEPDQQGIRLYYKDPEISIINKHIDINPGTSYETNIEYNLSMKYAMTTIGVNSRYQYRKIKYDDKKLKYD